MHLATYNNGLGARLVVAYKQILPDKPLTALVINVDKMVKNVDRDELLAMVHSREGAAERNFVDHLHKKGLLSYYHKSGFFEPVSIDNVIMTPGDGQNIPLRDVINALNAQSGVGPLPTQDQMDSLSTANPLASKQREQALNTENNHAVAKSIVVQAKMLMDDVNRKLDEALRLDPSLKTTIAQIRAGKPLTAPIQIEVNTAPVATETTEKNKVAARNKAIRAATRK